MAVETVVPIKKHAGGPDTHKPGCICRACTSRRRQKEALTFTTRDGRGSVATAKITQPVIEADFVVIGKSARDRVAQWVALRHQEPGIKTAEVAKRLGLSPHTLYAIIARAQREGWLRFDDPISRMEYEIVPKVLDNLSLFLDQKDRTATIEAAKGTIFKHYQEAKGNAEVPQTFVAIKIETTDADRTKIITGKIVGKAREAEE